VTAIRIEDAGDRLRRALPGRVRRERDSAAVRKHDASFRKFFFTVLVALDVDVGSNAIE
jgi:hypothetical protein